MECAIASVRAFNRFYTQRIGALDGRFLDSEVTLPEARLLFEIAQTDSILASELQARLGMDAGYVSRIVARFETRGWITRDRGGTDARRRPIALTPAGRSAFAAVDARQLAEVERMLAPLGPSRVAELTAALAKARALLDPAPDSAVTIRPFRVGDLGRIAARQSELYDASHGWGAGLELVELEAVASFLRGFEPGREQCWVAEIGGALAGSVMLTDEGGGLARLRLLYVEPFARGRGLGEALVDVCVRFARDAGYRDVTLWTHTVLEAARRLYARRGFSLVQTAMHEEFGAPVQGETWRLSLEG